jgi:phosphate transport system substrate-binding protein
LIDLIYLRHINLLLLKKTFISGILIVVCLVTLTSSSNNTKEPNSPELTGTLSLSGAFALYPMAVVWATEFKKIHPKVRIDISAGGTGKGVSDALAKLVDIGLVSRDVYPEELKKGGLATAVTKDAVVLTINSKNPNLGELLVKGIKKESLINIYAKGVYKDWKQLGLKKAAPIHAYTRSDASGAGDTWAKFVGIRQEDLMGVGVYGDPGVAQAVKKDPASIGYNNIAYVYDSKTKKPLQGIRIAPIDLNGNGRIDPEENFYYNLEALATAVANGKYPMPPARNLYFLTNGKPKSKVLVAFMKWVLTDGQKFVKGAGYINLSDKKLQESLNNLN